MIHLNFSPSGNAPKGYISDIQKMSTEDGPGIRTTVFFKECPLHCAWCHNPESMIKEPSIQWIAVKCIGCKTCIYTCSASALTFDDNGLHIDRKKCSSCGVCTQECPTTALCKIGEYWTVDALVAEVEKDLAYYINSNGGITASGGEAALQAEFIAEFFKRCKELGFHTALDTCGIVSKEKYQLVLPYTDLILFDIKEINPRKHKEFTGVSNELILANLLWLLDFITKNTPETKIWIRTPIIPSYTGTNENIHGIGKFIVDKLQNKVERWDLLAYNNLAKDKYVRMDLDYPCKGLKLYTRDEMEYFCTLAKSTGVKNVYWSGLTMHEKSNNKNDPEISYSSENGFKSQ